jgi:hypothetical protein
LPLELRHRLHIGVFAHQQVIFVREVPRERGEPVTRFVGDAGKAEVQVACFDELPDARPGNHGDAHLAAAASNQFVGNVLVDSLSGLARVEQAMFVQGQAQWTRAIRFAGGEDRRARVEQQQRKQKAPGDAQDGCRNSSHTYCTKVGAAGNDSDDCQATSGAGT